MNESSEAVRYYLSRNVLPKVVTVVDGGKLRALGEKVFAESGEPLESGAAVVKLDRSVRGIAKFILAVSVFWLGMLGWYLLRGGVAVYIHNPSWIVTPCILVIVISTIAFFGILQTGFSDAWLILEKDRARLRVRRMFRYRVESFPFASIGEIAVETFPASPRHGYLSRLTVTLGARQIELLRGQVEDAENGGIALITGLLSAATGLPVNRRIHRRFWENQ